MREASRKRNQVPRKARQCAGGLSTEATQGKDGWKNWDPFTRATGAALRQLNRRQDPYDQLNDVGEALL